MQPDEEFLKKLANYPEDYWFELGATGVIINGGTRAPSNKKKKNGKDGGGAGAGKDNNLSLIHI